LSHKTFQKLNGKDKEIINGLKNGNMSLIESLAKGFVRSAVNQVGRDGTTSSGKKPLPMRNWTGLYTNLTA